MSIRKSFVSSLARRVTVGFLSAGLLLSTQPLSAAALPRQKEKKEKDNKKDKDKGQLTSQTGAQCTPGTGGPTDAGGSAATSAPTGDIISKFAQHESDFKLARENYTYSQEVLVEEAAPNPGEYQLDSEVVFTPQGRRYENITYAPAPSLHDFSLSPEDMKDLEDIQPFVLTTQDLPKYDIQAAGTEKLDELNTYKFCVGPKRIEKGQRYFQGTVWVDGRDLAVVKTDGKAVPDIINKDNQNLFPRFATYRENIEGTFWFPTYTHADDILHFSSIGDVRIRMTVRYKNYKRFGSTIQLGQSREIPGGAPSTPPNSSPATTAPAPK